MVEYLGEGGRGLQRFAPKLAPEDVLTVDAAKVVDATYMQVEVPAIRPPRYGVAPGVRLKPLNALCQAGMLTQGGQGGGCGGVALLASQLHGIPNHFLLNSHGILHLAPLAERIRYHPRYQLQREERQPERFVVVGAGKTGMDAVLFLLDHGPGPPGAV